MARSPFDKLEHLDAGLQKTGLANPALVRRHPGPFWPRVTDMPPSLEGFRQAEMASTDNRPKWTRWCPPDDVNSVTSPASKGGQQKWLPASQQAQPLGTRHHPPGGLQFSANVRFQHGAPASPWHDGWDWGDVHPSARNPLLDLAWGVPHGIGWTDPVRKTERMGSRLAPAWPAGWKCSDTLRPRSAGAA